MTSVDVAVTDAVRRLLDLLAADASSEQLAQVPMAGLSDAERAELARATEVALRIRHTLTEHRRREAELRALFDTASDLSKLRDLDAVLRSIVHRARMLLRADLSYLSLNDEAAGTTYMRVTDGSVSSLLPQLRIGHGEGLGGLVAQTAHPYASADYLTDSRFAHTPAIDDAVSAERMVGILGVPLLLGSKVIGVLFAADRQRREFTAEEVALLSSLADHAAVAIDNAQLLEETSRANETISANNQAMRQAEDTHDRLMDLVLRGGDVAEVAAEVATVLSGGITFFDDVGGELARASGNTHRPPSHTSGPPAAASPTSQAPATGPSHTTGPPATATGRHHASTNRPSGPSATGGPTQATGGNITADHDYRPPATDPSHIPHPPITNSPTTTGDPTTGSGSQPRAINPSHIPSPPTTGNPTIGGPTTDHGSHAPITNPSPTPWPATAGSPTATGIPTTDSGTQPPVSNPSHPSSPTTGNPATGHASQAPATDPNHTPSPPTSGNPTGAGSPSTTGNPTTDHGSLPPTTGLPATGHVSQRSATDPSHTSLPPTSGNPTATGHPTAGHTSQGPATDPNNTPWPSTPGSPTTTSNLAPAPASQGPAADPNHAPWPQTIGSPAVGGPTPDDGSQSPITNPSDAATTGSPTTTGFPTADGGTQPPVANPSHPSTPPAIGSPATNPASQAPGTDPNHTSSPPAARNPAAGSPSTPSSLAARRGSWALAAGTGSPSVGRGFATDPGAAGVVVGTSNAATRSGFAGAVGAVGAVGAAVTWSEEAAAASRAAGRAVRVGDRWVCAVVAGPELLGSLVLTGRPSLDEAGRRLFERAGVVAALLLLLRRSVAQAEDEVRGELLTDLLTAPTRNPAALLARGRRLGIDLAAPHAVLIAHIDGGSRRRLAIACGRFATLVGLHAEQVVLLVADGDPAELASRLASSLTSSVEAPVTVGASGPAAGPAALATAFDEARRCVRALLALGRAGEGAALGDLGFVGQLIGDRTDLGGYVHATLGPVLDYDERRGTDLVATLRAYFESGTNLTRAKDVLHVHVNTVVQRLDRIATLLGADWQSPDRALEIQIALRLHQLHG